MKKKKKEPKQDYEKIQERTIWLILGFILFTIIIFAIKFG